MIELTGAPLPVLSLVWPLLLACLVALPPLHRRAIRLLPLAPLPALWLGLAGGQGRTLSPDMLLGMDLQAEPAGALLLALTAALWLAAGLYAQGYMAGTRKPEVFAGAWCLTLAGNLGVFLAGDVVSFYVAFATVSFAAYLLVVHEGDRAALKAGRVYIVMIVLGDVCLLAAFVIGIAAAESLAIADIRTALRDAPLGGLAVTLLIAGFGVKAGLMPLHVWLPLAHPAAPTPASAVLSGAIVKAGIIGLILFLPPGTGFAECLMAIGFLGAFVGALLGLTQADPKAILAYSTISQMSLVTALVGAAARSGDGFAQTAFYALHHGLAKGALFLSVGLVASCRGIWRSAVLVSVVLVALSVAGAPLTGGGLAKLAAKSGLEAMAGTALTVSAATTTLVLAWFVARLASTEREAGSGQPAPFLAVPTLTLGLGALVVPWVLWPECSGLPPDYPFHLSSLWSSSWPVLAGLAFVAGAGKSGLRTPTLPQGDIVAAIPPGLPLVRRARQLTAMLGELHAIHARATDASPSFLRLSTSFVPVLDQRLQRGNYSTAMLAAFAGAIAAFGLL